MKFRSILKNLYYAIKTNFGRKLFPRQYKHEYVFFENIRSGTYYDLSYEQSKLRSKAHQIDKVLVFPEVKKRDVLAEEVAMLIEKIGKNPDHDVPTMEWAKNVLGEYKNRQQGVSTLNKSFKQFNSDERLLLEQLITSRRSIRSFKPDVIDREVLVKILRSGLWGPTGCNRQNIEFLIVRTKEDIQFCQRIAGEGFSFPTESPVSVIVLVDPRTYALPNQRHMAYLETGAAVQNILLTAYSYGVGSCWLFWSDTRGHYSKFIKRFNLNPVLLPTAMIVLGYPDSLPKFRPLRKDVNNSVHWAE